MAPVVSPCSYLHVWIIWRRRSNIASITDAVTLSHVITTFQNFENVIMARATSPSSWCIVNPLEMLFTQLRRWLIRLPTPANPTLQYARLPHRFSFHFCSRAVSGAIPERRKRMSIVVPILAVGQIFFCHVGEMCFQYLHVVRPHWAECYRLDFLYLGRCDYFRAWCMDFVASINLHASIVQSLRCILQWTWRRWPIRSATHLSA